MQCGRHHSTLIDFEHIVTEYTPVSGHVSTMDVDQLASTEKNTGYYLKESYADEIEHNKSRHRDMHGDYVL